MQCNHCGKIVPSTSKICMFCNQEIDPNAHYVPPEGEGEIGNIEDTGYDTKLNIKVVNDYLKNPTYKKYVYIGIAIVVVFFILIIALIVGSFGGNKKSSSDVFVKVVDTLYDYVDESLLDKNGHTGNATVEIKYNKLDYQFTGDYVFDPLNKYYSYTGNLDGKYSSSDIKIDSKILPINLLVRDNEVFIKSDDLNELPLSGDLTLISEYLNLKSYDMDKLVDSYHDALVSTLKQMSYKTSTEKINFRGEMTSTSKVSLILDSSNMYKFYEKLFTNLMESTKFINQFGYIKNMDKDGVKTYFKDLLKNYEYKYSSNNKDVVTFSINYSNKTIYRITCEIKSDETKKYQIEINDNSYFFDYFVNDKNIYSGSIASSSKDLTNKIHGEIAITFDSDSYLTDIKIKYDDDKKPSYKKTSYTETLDLSSISEEDYNSYKNKLGGYIDETYILDKFKKVFETDCSSELECTCSEVTCRCKLEEKYITCPVKLIEKK